LELAEINRDFNRIKQVTIIESDLYQNIPQTFDAIITNPPIRAGKKVVHAIFEEGKNHLNPGGSIFAVVQKKQGALSLQEKMMEVFSNVNVLGKESGYYVFMSRKEDHDEEQ
jgi:16S rRNA (guanine1207-N2)-methyltransferase